MNGSSDIILKLFDTLKDSTDKNERTMQTLINQQQTLVDTVTHMPIAEIRQEVKDHIVSAHEERKGIISIINKIDSKVTKMILVVVVAFTILGVSYVYVRNTVDLQQKALQIESIKKQ